MERLDKWLQRGPMWLQVIKVFGLLAGIGWLGIWLESMFPWMRATCIGCD
jgi:hypothetical protein